MMLRQPEQIPFNTIAMISAAVLDSKYKNKRVQFNKDKKILIAKLKSILALIENNNVENIYKMLEVIETKKTDIDRNDCRWLQPRDKLIDMIYPIFLIHAGLFRTIFLSLFFCIYHEYHLLIESRNFDQAIENLHRAITNKLRIKILNLM